MSVFPKTGDTFNDRFILLEQLGSGGLGTVFKARENESGRELALKILHDKDVLENQEFGQRFLREAKALGEMEHSGIVKIYFIGLDDSGAPFIAMELLQGKSLREVLLENKKLPVVRAIQIVRRLAEILEHVHSRGVVHRDLKPENIMLSDLPEPDTVKLLDFGLASFHTEQKLTRTGAILGTANYMSPEQCRGKRADQRSDIYSLSVCFYELLTGTPPFSSDNPVNVLAKHISESVPEITQAILGPASRPLNSFLARGLAKDPEKRFQSMKEFASELDAVEESLATCSVASKPVFSGGMILLVVALLGLGLAATIMLKQSGNKPVLASGPAAVGSTSSAVADDAERNKHQLALAKQDFDRWCSRFKGLTEDRNSYAEKLANAASKLATIYQSQNEPFSKVEAVMQRAIDVMLASHDGVCNYYIERLRENQISIAVGLKDYDLAEKYLKMTDVVFSEGSLADCDRRMSSIAVDVARHRFKQASANFKKVVSLPGVAADEGIPVSRATKEPQVPYLSKRINFINSHLDVKRLQGEVELFDALVLLNDLNEIASAQYFDVSEKLLRESDEIIERHHSKSSLWEKELSRTELLRQELNRNKLEKEKERKR